MKSKSLVAASILSFIGIIIFILNLIGYRHIIDILPFLEDGYWKLLLVPVFGIWPLINPFMLILSVSILVLSIISIRKLRRMNLPIRFAVYNLAIGIFLFAIFPVLALFVLYSL